MADGLLSSALGAIDRTKQALGARFGLLASNPEEFARQLAAEARQRAGVGLLGEPKTAEEMASGAWINTPYGMQAMQAGSGFAGSTSFIKPSNLSASQWATEALSELKANPKSVAARQKYIDAKELLDNEIAAANKQPQPLLASQEQTYKGEHSAPLKDSGKPLWDLSGIYPDDFYSSQGARFYGDGADIGRDTRIVMQMQSFKNRPDRPVTIYRAVPKDVPYGKGINVGDWITLDRQYAKEHGEGALQGNYKIVKKTVKARDIFTNGDSIYEFGYDPQPFVPKSQR